MLVDRMAVLSAMVDQGVIPVFYHPDVEVCKKVIQACANGGAKCIEFTNRGDFASHVFLDVARHFAKADPERDHGCRLCRRRADRRHLYRQRGEICRRSAVERRRRQGVQPSQDRLQPWLRIDVRNRLCRRAGLRDRQESSPATWSEGRISSNRCWLPVRGRASCRPAAWTAPKNSLRKWFNAGVACVGIGSKLITKQLLDRQDYAGVEKKVRDTIQLIKTIRGK